MTGLRERKKEQTRERIAAVALRLFSERGFDAVTVNEIAEAAEVAKATLFTYFPTKESLALRGVGDDDLAGIITRRPPEQSPLEALRAHHRAFATTQATVGDLDALIASVRVIFDSPTLTAAANGLLYEQRQALAEALADEYGETTAALMAAQIAASLLTLQESYCHRLLAGVSPQETGRALAEDVELAFDLLEHGLHHARKKK
ncbi:TetR family transcriptional regulator [Streptomyces sp. NPDC053427]|uniref:TetR family transcriptional regulator n=1 Tax=Streptomyces sp. NPDC053427 TaxID=3365701 RepID=UPI0037CE67F4